MAMKDAQGFFDALQWSDVDFTMKGVGNPTYQLGADFFQDDDGTICPGAQPYAKCLCANFESLYGSNPSLYFPHWIMTTAQNLRFSLLWA